MDQIQFLFFDPLSAFGNLSYHSIFLGPKYKNLKFCDFLALYSLNQLVNNFGLKIINFQSLAFNGLTMKIMFHSYFERKNDKVLMFDVVHFPKGDFTLDGM